MRATLPTTLLSLILLLLPSVISDPLSVPFDDCFDETDSESQKFQVNTVYAQVLKNDQWGNYLNLTVFGTSPKDILGHTNSSTSLCECKVYLSELASSIFVLSNPLHLNLYLDPQRMVE